MNWVYFIIAVKSIRRALCSRDYVFALFLPRKPSSLDKYIIKTLSKVPSDIGQKLSYFLATGNLVSNTGLDLQQVCFIGNIFLSLRWQ